jgi:Winged helix-turn helix
MKPPIFVRELSKQERESLEAGLRSRETFVMRRCQILLASARGLSPPKIALSLGCGSQTARNAIHAFNQRGMDALTPGSSRPKHLHAAFDGEGAEALRGLLHRSPREFGYQTSLWTLGRWPRRSPSRKGSPGGGSRGDYTCHPLAPARDTLAAGETLDHFPRPPVRTKKQARPADKGGRGQPGVGSRFPGRVLVEQGRPAHVEQLLRGEEARSHDPAVGVAKDDPSEATKAISCYGLYLPRLGDMWAISRSLERCSSLSGPSSSMFSSIESILPSSVSHLAQSSA